jgi:hypothetical protein
VAYTALLDANVLHPVSLCDLLLRFAERGFYRPLWSEEILEETAASVLARHPGIAPAALARRFDHMRRAFPDASVVGYQPLAASLESLGTDAHVVAAAVTGRADVIVTQNVRDFPDAVLAPHRIEAQPADDFLVHQWWLDPQAAALVVKEQSDGTRRPHYPPRELLAHLSKLVPGFARLARDSPELARLL